ncbi:MAG: M20/M25/M40 family metallo-hydrolase [Bacteroidota bacterium]
MKYTIALVFFLSVFGLLSAQNGITEKQFLSHEKYFSSDKLEGRFPGTKGNNKAARYIAKQFKRLHLKRWNDGYRQPFSLFIKPQTNSVSKDTIQTQNIVGYLEGTDPILKNEYIVIGAHYDHLGWGGQGTGSKKKDTLAIHNGADDNASGVSALLCIVAEVAKQQHNIKRSIIFIAFSGEEEGLKGSAYFVNHLPVSQSSISLMINMDMVGRLNTEKQIYMGGAGTFPGGEVLMKKLAEGTELNPVVHAGSVGGSDHVTFYKNKISVLGLHTGGHPQYHTPEDDLALINSKGAVAVTQYICKALLAIANYPQPIYFIPQE